jgi:hypothetical protein
VKIFKKNFWKIKFKNKLLEKEQPDMNDGPDQENFLPFGPVINLHIFFIYFFIFFIIFFDEGGNVVNSGR